MGVPSFIRENRPRDASALTAEQHALWHAWLTNRLPDDRLRLYVHYAPWMQRVAARLAKSRPPLTDWGDCLGHAAEGLLQAIDRYRPQAGVRFESYAEYYVHGCVQRGLATFRREQKLRRSDANTWAGVSAGAGTKTETHEGAREGVVGQGFARFLELGITDNTLPHESDPCFLQQQWQRSETLSRLLPGLPERERALLHMRYQEHLTFTCIATTMGVSTVRVLQLHGQAITRLRKQFTEETE